MKNLDAFSIEFMYISDIKILFAFNPIIIWNQAVLMIYFFMFRMIWSVLHQIN